MRRLTSQRALWRVHYRDQTRPLLFKDYPLYLGYYFLWINQQAAGMCMISWSRYRTSAISSLFFFLSFFDFLLVNKTRPLVICASDEQVVIDKCLSSISSSLFLPPFLPLVWKEWIKEEGKKRRRNRTDGTCSTVYAPMIYSQRRLRVTRHDRNLFGCTGGTAPLTPVVANQDWKKKFFHNYLFYLFYKWRIFHFWMNLIWFSCRFFIRLVFWRLESALINCWFKVSD